MAVEYKLIPKRNPQDPEAEPKYYATPVYHKTITMEELAREVSARSTTTSEGDVYSVLVDVRDIIRARSYVPATSAASIPKPGNLYPMPSAAFEVEAAELSGRGCRASPGAFLGAQFAETLPAARPSRTASGFFCKKVLYFDLKLPIRPPVFSQL